MTSESIRLIVLHIAAFLSCGIALVIAQQLVRLVQIAVRRMTDGSRCPVSLRFGRPGETFGLSRKATATHN